MPKTAFNRAMDYLAVRPLSAGELRSKLLRAGYAGEETECAVTACREHGYLNDALLAEDAARFLSAGGRGRNLVRRKLRQRGLDNDVVESALAATAPDEKEAARLALAGKLRSLVRESDPRKKSAKAFRFLISRGFAPNLAAELLRAELGGEGENNGVLDDD